MSTTTEYHYYCTNCKDSLISKSSCQTCKKNDTPGYFTVLPIEKQLSSMLISTNLFEKR